MSNGYLAAHTGMKFEDVMRATEGSDPTEKIISHRELLRGGLAAEKALAINYQDHNL